MNMLGTKYFSLPDEVKLDVNLLGLNSFHEVVDCLFDAGVSNPVIELYLLYSKDREYKSKQVLTSRMINNLNLDTRYEEMDKFVEKVENEELLPEAILLGMFLPFYHFADEDVDLSKINGALDYLTQHTSFTEMIILMETLPEFTNANLDTFFMLVKNKDNYSSHTEDQIILTTKTSEFHIGLSLVHSMVHQDDCQVFNTKEQLTYSVDGYNLPVFICRSRTDRDFNFAPDGEYFYYILESQPIGVKDGEDVLSAIQYSSLPETVKLVNGRITEKELGKFIKYILVKLGGTLINAVENPLAVLTK